MYKEYIRHDYVFLSCSYPAIIDVLHFQVEYLYQ